MFHAPITRRATDDERPRFDMHNIHDDHGRYRTVAGQLLLSHESPDNDTLVSGTPQDGLESRSDGTWGERDIGGPVNHRVAMQDYEMLRRELTTLSKTRSRSQPRRKSITLARGISERSTIRANRGRSTIDDERSSETEYAEGAEREEPAEDVEEKEETEGDDGDFALDQFMREGHFEKRVDNRSAKRVGVVYRNLTVKGIGSTATFVRELPDAVIGTFGPDLYKLACRFMPFLAFGRKGATRTLINDFTGMVRDGEMMLVLGRPVSKNNNG